MASWCWICGNKVNNTYVWYKGDKCHPGCKKMKQDQAKARKERERLEKTPPTDRSERIHLPSRLDGQ